jgi:hypothetical protein
VPTVAHDSATVSSIRACRRRMADSVETQAASWNCSSTGVATWCRVVKVDPAYSSQTCAVCSVIDALCRRLWR